MTAHPLMRPDVPLYLADGGIETTLIFLNGLDLPEFAAFPLLDTPQGRAQLTAYYEPYIQIALQAEMGFVLETPTWRASKKWGGKLGYRDTDLYCANVQAVRLMQALRERYQTDRTPMLISGCLGPQDDGYEPAHRMDVQQARDYHSHQVKAFKEANADMVTAITMAYVEEAIGIANAGVAADIPVVISFTVETDGRLPVGMTLKDAIAQVDETAEVPPAYYMINCAHPDHFHLARGERWLGRIGGVRANASRMSHAELDESDTLDDGDPQEFGRLHREVKALLPNLRVIGGCCGTDHRHVGEVANCCAQTPA